MAVIKVQLAQPGKFQVWLDGILQDERGLVWDDELNRIVEEFDRGFPGPATRRRASERLEAFLGPGWQLIAGRLGALEERTEEVVIRSDRRPILELPWQQLRLTDQLDDTIGGREFSVRLSLEKIDAGAEAAPQREPRPEGGRVLFAWHHPSEEVWSKDFLASYDALKEDAPACYRHSKRSWVDVVPNASLGDILHKLDAAKGGPDPYRMLHIACHGAWRADGANFGLALRAGEGEAAEPVASALLADRLASHVRDVDLVLLTVCHGGAGGGIGATLCSPAIELHGRGFRAVVAWSRSVLVDHAVPFTRYLLAGLLSDGKDVRSAVVHARRSAAAAATPGARSLRVFASAEPSHRPFTFAPYRGLTTFEEAHARFYFGREAEADRLEGVIERQRSEGPARIAVVTGASGSGKSSFVRAGLLPRLRKQGWDVRTLEGDVLGDADLDAALAGIEREAQGADKILVVVDQIEGLLHAGMRAKEVPAALLRMTALASGGAPCSVLLVVRTGHVEALERVFVGPPEARESLGVALQRRSDGVLIHGVELGPPDTGTLERVIAEPARLVGLTFHGAPRSVTELAAALERQPGSLPLLEFALDDAWRRREGDEMTLPPNVASRMADLLEDLYEPRQGQRPSRAFQDALRDVLVELVDIASEASFDGLRGRTERELMPELLEGGNSDERRRALEALVDRRVVVQDVAESGERRYRIGHYALIGAWRRLREWVDEVRARRVALARYAVDAERWREAPKDGSRLKLRGAELQAALGDVAGHGQADDASTLRVVAYVRACRGREKRQTWLLGGSLVVGVAAVFGLVLLLLAIDEREEESLARLCANLNQEALNRHGGDTGAVTWQEAEIPLSLMFRAIEAGCDRGETGLIWGVDALLTGVASRAARHRVVMDVGLARGDQVTALRVSADARYIATLLAGGRVLVVHPEAMKSMTADSDPIQATQIDFAVREPGLLGALGHEGLQLIYLGSGRNGVDPPGVVDRVLVPGVRDFDLFDAERWLVVDERDEVWLVEQGRWHLVPTLGTVLDLRFSQDGKEILLLEVLEPPDAIDELPRFRAAAWPVRVVKRDATAGTRPWSRCFDRAPAYAASWAPDGATLGVCLKGWEPFTLDALAGSPGVTSPQRETQEGREVIVLPWCEATCSSANGVLYLDAQKQARWIPRGESAPLSLHEADVVLSVDGESCETLARTTSGVELVGGDEGLNASVTIVAASPWPPGKPSRHGPRAALLAVSSAAGLVEIVDRRTQPPFDRLAAARHLCGWLRPVVPDDKKLKAACDRLVGPVPEVAIPPAPARRVASGEVAPGEGRCRELSAVWGVRAGCDDCAAPAPLRLTVMDDCRFSVARSYAFKAEWAGYVDPINRTLAIAQGALDGNGYALRFTKASGDPDWKLRGEAGEVSLIGERWREWPAEPSVAAVRCAGDGAADAPAAGSSAPRTEGSVVDSDTAASRVIESLEDVWTDRATRLRLLRKLRALGTSKTCEYLKSLRSTLEPELNEGWDRRLYDVTEEEGCLKTQ